MAEAARLRERARALYAQAAKIEGMPKGQRAAVAVAKSSAGLGDELLAACFAAGIPSVQALGKELRAAKVGTYSTVAMARRGERPIRRAVAEWIQRRLGKEGGRWRYPIERWPRLKD